MKRAIIFGSSGFVGAALAKHFKTKGYCVIGCDVINSDTDKFLDRFYFAEDNQESLNKIFSEQFDVCVNCAGSASVSYSFDNPFHDYELNTRIVFRILTAIKENNPLCRFLNLSSAAVYGNPKALPVSEKSRVKPLSPYGNHKYMSEMICRQFYEFFNIQTCSLRIFSAYGPGLRKQIFWDMFQKAKVNNSITLFGTGDETRDFIYIQDLVKAIELVAVSDIYNHREINIANGQKVRIRDAADIFFGKFDQDKRYFFSGEEKTGDPVNWQADISILKSMGYVQEFEIEEGIAEFVKWVRIAGYA
jgi:UDP-glucose 4-epimerase